MTTHVYSKDSTVSIISFVFVICSKLKFSDAQTHYD